MLKASIRVGCLVQDQLVVGELALNGHRLQEMLVDPASKYLHVLNASILSNGGDEIDLDEAVVCKTHLSLIALLQDGHEAEDKRFFGFVEKKCRHASMVVSGWQLRGKIHFRGRTDPVAFLEREVSTFFPITEAAMSRRGETDIQYPVVFVNQAHVSLCGFAAEAPTELQAVRDPSDASAAAEVLFRR
jgi:hypothetical protein